MRTATLLLPLLLVLSVGAAAQQQPPAATAKVKKDASQSPAAQGLGSHNSNAPIDITSNSFDYDLNSKIGTYVGNVVAIQGDMRMRADKMKVNLAQGKPTHIEATGKVVVVAPNGVTTGDIGEYELASRTMTMTGNVVLTKQKDVMRGTKLVMDMNTNIAHLYAQGMPGNRVRGFFVQEKSTGAAAAKKSGAGSQDKDAAAAAKSAASPAK